MSDRKSIFDTLAVIDMGHKLKALQGQRYLSWYDVEAELSKHFPLFEEKINFTADGLPYIATPLGIFVNVTVTIDGYAKTEIFPVLDGANRSLKMGAYEYMTRSGKKTVKACTSFDINTSIKRAFVKCVARHGLGIYVYQDLPTAEAETVNSTQLQQMMNKINERGLNVHAVSQAFNINKPAQLHEINFENFMKFVEDF